MSPVRIAVLVSGSGSNLQTIIDHIEDKKINGEIAVVVSNRSSAYGLERAKKHNIEGIFLSAKGLDDEAYSREIVKVLKERNVELVVLAGYLKIISPYFVEEFRNRIINIHPSLIPSFCGKGCYGLKVHEKAVEYGVKVSGATVHFVNEEADNGPIIIQKTVEVDYDDTAETLQKKVLKVEHEILPEAVRLFCDNKLSVIGRKVQIAKITS
ncbi:formyltetrahydrofolate-dependent phosphoribosylglycinamide formyltransferase [Dethiosulfatibacter aminovorans DSM 17477]|uniref:Phosphoribosylglycinamide formyltransferase n=1 Tax=Dethiosulfatibacter aminovorans DSM 17477 TaxID=1121476 RepID=A0A1M6FNY7_9FIRM|nr:phosphoribosylglycinamide formyltransferase [Dethiosulfatibacter aminovorans]SHI99373.1 formyltetrahydrofolate-dependent phosphoribosylglycinamide formyltransferase [Dethiosulfatibacter aminovorans DSM 17477]